MERQFFREILYYPELLLGLESTEINVQVDPKYSVFKFVQGSELESLLDFKTNGSRVLRIIDVDPKDPVLQQIKFGISPCPTSTLPHQDMLDREKNNDPRKFNLFYSRDIRTAFTYVLDKSYIEIFIEYLENKRIFNPELRRKLELESTVGIDTDLIDRFYSGDLSRAAKDDFRENRFEKDNVRDLFILATKISKGEKFVDPIINSIISSMSCYVPESQFYTETWSKPNTILIFDNNETYHGRFGPVLEGDPLKRKWIVDNKYT